MNSAGDFSGKVIILVGMVGNGRLKNTVKYKRGEEMEWGME